jgi:hypothetical protein
MHFDLPMKYKSALVYISGTTFIKTCKYYTYIHTYIHTYIYTYTHTYTHTHIHIHIHTHIHIHIHTHIHTYTPQTSLNFTHTNIIDIVLRKTVIVLTKYLR